MVFYWLSRLGRVKHIEHAVPLMFATATGTYIAYHMFGTPMVRKIFAVYDGPNERKIGSHLQKLIDEVTESTKDAVWMPTGFDRYVVRTPINWFLSPTLDFIHAGLTESRGGAVIGIPLHFEYESIDEVPDEPVCFARFKLLRDKPKNTNATKEEKEDEQLYRDIEKSINSNNYTQTTNVKKTKLNIAHTQEGQKFAESLILSDDARKFALARELFYVDGYQVILNYMTFNLIGLAAIFASRLAIRHLNLHNQHIMKRMTVYSFSTLVASTQLFLYRNFSQTFYDSRADERASLLGPQYISGGIEFYTKLLNRNKALKKMLEAVGPNETKKCENFRQWRYWS